MKRIVMIIGMALGLSLMPLALATAAGADVPNPNQSLNCSAGAPGTIHCTATDNDGIARIRVVDKETVTVVKVIRYSCAIPETKQTGFTFPNNGEPVRVQVLDCSGNVASYNVTPPLS